MFPPGSHTRQGKARTTTHVGCLNLIPGCLMLIPRCLNLNLIPGCLNLIPGCHFAQSAKAHPCFACGVSCCSPCFACGVSCCCLQWRELLTGSGIGLHADHLEHERGRLAGGLPLLRPNSGIACSVGERAPAQDLTILTNDLVWQLVRKLVGEARASIGTGKARTSDFLWPWIFKPTLRVRL